MKFLLSLPKIKIGDTILLAVVECKVELTEILLEKIRLEDSNAEFSGIEGSFAYPSYITPLILAAQCGHYSMIKMLLTRKHRIEYPHPVKCRCPKCK